jgi:zinc/manganese transport system substrate-binding protein
MRKILAIAVALLTAGGVASAKLTVGASLTDFASIAAYIGGDRVEVFSIARAVSDPHHVEVLPGYMVRVSRADFYLKSGLSLDQWADPIIDGSRNPRLRIVDCSQGVSVLEKPLTPVDASMGDVHPEGNPHYWLDPENGRIVAHTIHDALLSLDPAGSEAYDTNLARFEEELTRRNAEWKAEAAALPSRTFISYHSSWSYFAHAFGFTIAGKIEPLPGIPPTASHLASLLDVAREWKVSIIIQEPYFADDGPHYLARETGAKIVKLSPSCDDVSAASYLNHFQNVLDKLKEAEQ